MKRREMKTNLFRCYLLHLGAPDLRDEPAPGEVQGPQASDAITEEMKAIPLDNVGAVLQGENEHEKLSEGCHSVIDAVGKNMPQIQQITEELPVGQGEKGGCITTDSGTIIEGDTKQCGLVAYPSDSDLESDEQKANDVFDCIADTTKELPVEQIQAQVDGRPIGCLEVAFQKEAELDKKEQKVGEFQAQAEEVDCSTSCQEVAFQLQNELEKEEQKVSDVPDAKGESKIETGQTELPALEFQTGQSTSSQEVTFEGETKEGSSMGCEPQAEEKDCSLGCQDVPFQVQTGLEIKEQKVYNVADAKGESTVETSRTMTELPVLELQTREEEGHQSTSCQEATFKEETKEGFSVGCEPQAEEEDCSMDRQEVTFQVQTEIEIKDQKVCKVADAISESQFETGLTTMELPVLELQTQEEEAFQSTHCHEVTFQEETIEVGYSMSCEEVPVHGETKLENKDQRICDVADVVGESKIETGQTMTEHPVLEIQTQNEEEGQSTSRHEVVVQGETKEEGLSIGCEELPFPGGTELERNEQKVCNTDAIGETTVESRQRTEELSVAVSPTHAEEEGQSTSCQEATFQGETELQKREQSGTGVLVASGETIEVEQAMEETHIEHVQTPPKEECATQAEEEGQSTSCQEATFQGEPELRKSERSGSGPLVASGQTIVVEQAMEELHIEHVQLLPEEACPTQGEEEGQSSICQEASFQGENELQKREQSGGGVLVASGQAIEVEQTTEELHVEHIQTLPEEECQPTGCQEELKREGTSNNQTLSKELENKNSEKRECPALSTLETTTEALSSDYECNKALPSLEASSTSDIASGANEAPSVGLDSVEVEAAINSVGASAVQPEKECKEDKLATSEGDDVTIEDSGNDSVAPSAEQPPKEYIDDKLATLEGDVVTIEDCGMAVTMGAEEPAKEYKDDKLATAEGVLKIEDFGNDSVATMNAVTGEDCENDSVATNAEQPAKEYKDDKLATLEGDVVTIDDSGMTVAMVAEHHAKEYNDDKLATTEAVLKTEDCGNVSVATMNEVTGQGLEANISDEPNGEDKNQETCTEMQDGAVGSSVEERHSSPSEKIEDLIQVVEAPASEQMNEEGGAGESGSIHGIDEKEKTESESELKNSDVSKGETETSQTI